MNIDFSPPRNGTEPVEPTGHPQPPASRSMAIKQSARNPVTNSDQFKRQSSLHRRVSVPVSTNGLNAVGPSSSGAAAAHQIISNNKARFLETMRGDQLEFSPNNSQLTVEEIAAIAKNLEKKHGIILFVNGNGSRVAEHQKNWIQQEKEAISTPDGFCKAFREIESTLFLKEQMELHKKYGHFFEFSTFLSYRNFQRNKFEEFKACLQSDDFIWPKVSAQLEHRLESVEAKALQKGLPPSEFALEMIDMQLLAKKNNSPIGYLYPCISNWSEGANRGFAHIESFIVTPHNDIINIIPFGMTHSFFLEKAFKERGLGRPVDSDISHFFENSCKSLSPQAGGTECGSLGLAYLKEYLKNNGDQLWNFSLLVSKNSDNPADFSAKFLLPSPQVLRYSQSSMYVDVISAMVRSNEPSITMNRDSESYKVTSLRGLAANKTFSITATNRKPLSNADLDRFRANWIEEFDKYSAPKRDSMNITTSDGKSVNAYLTHLAIKNKVKAGTA